MVGPGQAPAPPRAVPVSVLALGCSNRATGNELSRRTSVNGTKHSQSERQGDPAPKPERAHWLKLPRSGNHREVSADDSDVDDVDQALRLEIARDCRLAAFACAAGEVELKQYLVDRASHNAMALGSAMGGMPPGGGTN